MTVVGPFRALRYDADRLDLSRVIAPPYDVIAADERASFFDRDPHNAIRFELTRDVQDEAATDYGWIRLTIDAWRESGVLIRDLEPGYYVMRQTYKAPSGEVLESPDDVFRTTGEGQVMPQKLTFFYPKIPTGLVFRDHRDLAPPSDEV